MGILDLPASAIKSPGMGTLIRLILTGAVLACSGCGSGPQYSKASQEEARDKLSRLKLHMTRKEVIAILKPIGWPQNGGSVGRIQTECWTLSNGVQVKLHFYIDQPAVGKSAFHSHDYYIDSEIGQLWRIVKVGKPPSLLSHLGSAEQIGGSTRSDQKGVK